MELQTVWFFIWGLLWAVFFMTDGFDLGIGTLYPFLGKSERDKHMMIHAMGPLWDGNEVWLLTAGGVTFAAFPLVYAVMFSSLYSALMLILFALILRGVSFEFRNKVDSVAWKKVWDISIFIGSFLPALLFGDNLRRDSLIARFIVVSASSVMSIRTRTKEIGVGVGPLGMDGLASLDDNGTAGRTPA